MKARRIVVLDGYTLNPGDLDWTPLSELGPLEVHEWTAPADVAARIAGADVVFTNKTPLTAETLSAARGLRFVGVLATGYNIVDVKAAETSGVRVANVPGYGTAAQTRTLKLVGLNTDTNTLAANIADNSGAAVSVEKDGSGTWVLSGSSTYTGGITNRAGTLVFGSVGASGSGSSDIALGVAGGNTNATILTGISLALGRNIRLQSSDNSDAGTRILAIGANTATTSEFSGNIMLGTANFSSRGVTLTAAAGGQVTFSGIIQDPTGQSAAEKTNALAIIAVTKEGAGTVVLNNLNTYTGKTRVASGTLKLTGSGSIASSTGIEIGGGSTLDVSTLTAQMTLAATQALVASGTTTTGTLATDTGKGMTLNSASPLRFSVLKPAASGGAVPLTLSGAGTLTRGASTPVTITV
ncbi:MAG: autotransporter-associated beta strand repeat-containing protein, partial [Opitutales bacterium]